MLNVYEIFFFIISLFSLKISSFISHIYIYKYHYYQANVIISNSNDETTKKKQQLSKSKM